MADAVPSEARAGHPAHRGAVRVFASSSHEPRSRRASDVIWLVISVLVLAWAAWNASDTTTAEEAFVDFLRSWPTWAIQVFELLFVLASVYAIGLLIGITFFARNRLDVARDMYIGLLIALVVSQLVGQLVSDEWTSLFSALFDRDGPPRRTRWGHDRRRLGGVGETHLRFSGGPSDSGPRGRGPG